MKRGGVIPARRVTTEDRIKASDEAERQLAKQPVLDTPAPAGEGATPPMNEAKPKTKRKPWEPTDDVKTNYSFTFTAAQRAKAEWMMSAVPGMSSKQVILAAALDMFAEKMIEKWHKD